MAVLRFFRAETVLSAQAAMLPQPDQLCGPFAARAALHAVLDPSDVPATIDIARAAGTSIWPHDIAEWRPAGAPLVPTGWDRLPTAADIDSCGTDARGLAQGIVEATGGSVAVVPVSGEGADAVALGALLAAVAEHPIGVLANVRTGAVDPDADWDVGHFMVLWAVDLDRPGGTSVAVADTYREVGAPGEPAGCRWVKLPRLAQGIDAAPGRGLLLLTGAGEAATVAGTVERSGLDSRIWSV